MKDKMAWTVFCIFSFLVPINVVHAEVDSQDESSEVTLVIVSKANLRIIDGTVSKVLMEDGSAEKALDQGFIELDKDKPTLIVNSNRPWGIFVKSSGFEGPYPKATTDLMLIDRAKQHVVNGFDNFKLLTTNYQLLAGYWRGVRDESHPCQYKILLDYTKDVPGTYECIVTYKMVIVGW